MTACCGAADITGYANSVPAHLHLHANPDDEEWEARTMMPGTFLILNSLHAMMPQQLESLQARLTEPCAATILQSQVD